MLALGGGLAFGSPAAQTTAPTAVLLAGSEPSAVAEPAAAEAFDGMKVTEFAATRKLEGEFREYVFAALGIDDDSEMGDLTSTPMDMAQAAFASTKIGTRDAPPMIVGKAMKFFRLCAVALPPPGTKAAPASSQAPPAPTIAAPTNGGDLADV